MTDQYDIQRTLKGIQLLLDDSDKEKFFLRYKKWPEPLVSLFYRVSKPFREKPNLDTATVTVDGHMSFPMAHLEHVDPKIHGDHRGDISKWSGLKKDGHREYVCVPRPEAPNQPEEKTFMQVNTWAHEPRSLLTDRGQVWVEEFTTQRILEFVKETQYPVDIRYQGIGPDGVTVWVTVYGIPVETGRRWREQGIKGEQK